MLKRILQKKIFVLVSKVMLSLVGILLLVSGIPAVAASSIMSQAKPASAEKTQSTDQALQESSTLDFNQALTNSLLNCQYAYADEYLNSPSAQEMLQILKSLKGVSSVSFVNNGENSDLFIAKYLITFTQPVSWDDPSLGTFEQRIVFAYRGINNINVFNVSGYALGDKSGVSLDAGDDMVDVAGRYKANLFNIEYRFFGDSIPNGLTYDSVDEWKYLTINNAANDFHAIIQSVKSFFPAKTVFTGLSKGGYTTNAQSCFFPNDCDAYVSYSAPFCNSTNDDRFIKNVYETIGNSAYSAEEAAAKRDLLTRFQVDCIKNRASLQDLYWQKATVEDKKTFRDWCTKERLFDNVVLEVAVEIWQDHLCFEDIEKLLAMEPGETKNEAVIKKLIDIVPTFTFSVGGNFAYPYYIQTYKEMGGYYYDFSYLRNAVAKAKKEDPTFTTDLSIKQEEDKDMTAKMFFTEAQTQAFTYDSSTKDKLLEWSNTTDSNVIMIFGGIDPWYAVKIPETNNQNIHSYTAPKRNHTTGIGSLTEAEQKECISLLNSWLDVKIPPFATVSASSLPEDHEFDSRTIEPLQYEYLDKAIKEKGLCDYSFSFANANISKPTSKSFIHDVIVDLRFAYPSEIPSDKVNEYEFIVLHINQTAYGRFGDANCPEILSVDDKGIHVKSNCSPFALGYRLKTPAPTPGSDSDTANLSLSAAQTGDNTLIAIFGCLSIVLLASISGSIARYKKKLSIYLICSLL